MLQLAYSTKTPEVRKLGIRFQREKIHPREKEREKERKREREIDRESLSLRRERVPL